MDQSFIGSELKPRRTGFTDAEVTPEDYLFADTQSRTHDGRRGATICDRRTELQHLHEPILCAKDVRLYTQLLREMPGGLC